MRKLISEEINNSTANNSSSYKSVDSIKSSCQSGYKCSYKEGRNEICECKRTEE